MEASEDMLVEIKMKEGLDSLKKTLEVLGGDEDAQLGEEEHKQLKLSCLSMMEAVKETLEVLAKEDLPYEIMDALDQAVFALQKECGLVR